MKVLALSLLCLLLGVPTVRAETIVAPVGGQPVPLGGRLCTSGVDLQGWTLEADGKRLRPPAKAPAGPPAMLRVATELTQCASAATPLTAVALDAWPVVDPATVVLNVDAGRVDITGQNLRGVVLTWSSAGKSGSDVCHDPQTDPNKQIDSCAFSIDHELSAEPGQVSLSFLPSNVQLGDGTSGYDLAGRAIRLERYQINAAKVVLTTLLPVDVSMDADADVARIPLKHPEAVSSVECTDATCDIDGHEILVRGEHGTDENLEIRIRMRPHVYLQTSTQLDSFPSVVVPLQRCPLSLASASPLRGVGNQTLILRVGGRCRKDPSLRFFVSGIAARLVSTREEDDSLYAVVHADNALGDEVTVSMQRGGSVVGVARAHTRLVPSVHARVELPNVGPIDFIPSNRDATVVLPSLGDAASLTTLPVDGVYTVTRDAQGVDHVRGLDGATGWVALRLAYRDKTLPPALRDTNLADITDAVDRSIHPASLPIGLGLSAESKAPIVELVCGDADGHLQRVLPGVPSQVPFGSRDTCHLVLHRELLRPEDGDQALRINVNVSSLDGAPRSEASLDQRIVLKPGKDPKYLYIGGIVLPFDRVVVRATLLVDDARYAVSADDKVNAPQVQWSLTMGTDKLRFFATVALPTGLFRLADVGHSGFLGLNAGILLRFVWLTSTGYQSPVGLETGVMALNIAGDTTNAPAQVAAVVGLSVSVPIANASRTTQAAISLHAWFEYEISRAVMHQAGQPIGFVFGPSLSLGDVGVNF